jgi:hypothetical protein
MNQPTVDHDLSKRCTAAGCTGTMYLHNPLPEPPPPTHLEFPSRGVWVCGVDPAHVELLTVQAWNEIRRSQSS